MKSVVMDMAEAAQAARLIGLDAEVLRDEGADWVNLSSSSIKLLGASQIQIRAGSDSSCTIEIKQGATHTTPHSLKESEIIKGVLTMKRIFTALLAAAATAAIATPAAALEGRHADEFYDGLGNKLSERFEEELYDGLGNKLSNRHEDEFYSGLGNKLSERFEEELYDGLGNKVSGRHADEFYEGLGNKVSGRFEEEFYDGLGNKGYEENQANLRETFSH